MSENIEQFKAAFRQTQWCADMRGMRGMSDEEMFERANSGRTFYKIQTNDAWRIWRLASIRAARIVMRSVGVGEIRDMILHDMALPEPDRQTFETAFKETKEYKLHVDLGHMEEMYIFDRHPNEGWYYHPSVALAWKFYNLGAK
jgi:hypothetical protein